MLEEVKSFCDCQDTVSKSDYDALVKEYQRLSAAFNRAMSIIGNTYVEQLAKSIFEEVDKAANQSK